MTFVGLLKAVGDYLENTINAIMQKDEKDEPKIQKVVYDYPDMTMHSENKILFLHLSDVEYDTLTTESHLARIKIIVYGVIGGSDEETLQERLWAYADALYLAIEQDLSLGSFCDVSFIRSIRFYTDVEGVQNRKAFEAQIELLTET